MIEPNPSNISPKKKLGQFFLTDNSILEKEVKLADLNRTDTVLEVGAGPGNLTKKLAKQCKVIAIEKDKRFIPLLKGIDNCKLIYGDALSILKKDLNFNKVVSNIPYHLSQKILLTLLKKNWNNGVFIFQKEFADKLISNSKLSLLLKDCAHVNHIGLVPGQSFTPETVNSTLTTIDKKKNMNNEFWFFLKKIFRYKNKDLKNALNILSIEMDNIPVKKVHQLSLEEAKKIFKYFK